MQSRRVWGSFPPFSLRKQSVRTNCGRSIDKIASTKFFRFEHVCRSNWNTNLAFPRFRNNQAQVEQENVLNAHKRNQQDQYQEIPPIYFHLLCAKVGWGEMKSWWEFICQTSRLILTALRSRQSMHQDNWYWACSENISATSAGDVDSKHMPRLLDESFVKD